MCFIFLLHLALSHYLHIKIMSSLTDCPPRAPPAPRFPAAGVHFKGCCKSVSSSLATSVSVLLSTLNPEDMHLHLLRLKLFLRARLSRCRQQETGRSRTSRYTAVPGQVLGWRKQEEKESHILILSFPPFHHPCRRLDHNQLLSAASDGPCSPMSNFRDDSHFCTCY